MLPAFLVALTWVPPLLGLGASVRHVRDPALRPGVAGLLGLGAAGVLGAWLNPWTALSPAVSAGIWVSGAALFLLRRRWLFERWDWRDGGVGVALLAVLSHELRHPLFQYDTGYYHLQTVEWITGTSLLPGLANVHFRLGFNSLWHVTAAALEHPLAAGKSQYFLNQLPILFAGLIALVGLRRLVAGDRSFSNLMLAGIALPMASATFGLGGLYVDYTVALVVYVALALWARALRPGDDFAEHAAPALLLSLLALLLRVSTALVPAAALVFLVARGRDLPRAWWVRTSAIAAAAAGPWLVRGILLSGCLAFPMWGTCLDGLPWTVPEEKTRSVAAWVTSWAQRPGPLQEGWGWLGEWPARVLMDYPEATLLPCLLAGGIALSIVGRRPWPREAVWILAAALASVVHWFLAAPEPRFALGPLFVLGLAPLLAWLATTEALAAARRARLATAAAILAVSLGLAGALHDQRRTGMGRSAGMSEWTPPLLDWPEPHDPAVAVRTTASGLRVVVPIAGERCGRAPIPCTPAQEFDPALRFHDGYFTVAR